MTGVQTCALPICAKVLEKGDEILERAAEIGADLKDKAGDFIDHANVEAEKMKMEETIEEAKRAAEVAEARRSEERRVGKECRSRWSPDE